MFPRPQIVLTLLFALLCGPVAAVGTPPSAPEEEDTTRNDLASNVEKYAVSRAQIKWCTSNTRIGDYAEVAYRFCYAGSEDYDRRTAVSTSKTKFSIDIAASDGATATVKGKRGTAYTVGYREYSFGKEAADFILNEETGISLLSHGPDLTRIKGTVTAQIATSYASGETWSLVAEELQREKGNGTLTNGVRTLQMTLRGTSSFSKEECDKMMLAGDDVRACFRKIAEIHEDGALLFSYVSEGQQYIFRAGLGPELKLLLLAGMEAFRAAGKDDSAVSTW